MTTPLLSVKDLTLTYQTGRGRLRALNGVSFDVNAGETLAVVGESGSGKSSVALAAMGLLGPEAHLDGSIRFEDGELIGLDEASRRALRGRAIGMVFQDPFTSLNPSLRIGEQVAEPLVYHQGLSRAEALEKAVAALGEVGLPGPREIASAYPHQLSGGMQQRVLIASAIVCNPRLLILDEPTTALDVTVEAQILDLLDNLRRSRGLGMVFITHNLGVVNRIADRVCVLYAGRVVEVGEKDTVLGRPSHPYTKGLLASLPRLAADGRARRIAPIPGRFPDLVNAPPGCIFAPRCPFAESACVENEQVLATDAAGNGARCWKSAGLPGWPEEPADDRNIIEVAASREPAEDDAPLLRTEDLSKRYRRGRIGGGIEWTRKLGVIPWPSTRAETVNAVDGISLEIRRGEVVGLVGESGSGKSTFGRTILRLVDPSSGHVMFDSRDVASLPDGELDDLRKRAQIVFQNPDSSLNPRRRIGKAIARAVKLQTNVPPERLRAHVEDLLDRVGLPRAYYDRYPHQLSGGEKQRVGIARALATEPEFIVCDEPVSALDVSVQATVLNLLDGLKDELNLSYLFISHDLSVVAYIADRIAVMYSGRLCEVGPADAVLQPPYHPYTQALLSAVPLPTPGAARRERIRLRGDRPPSGAQRSGCVFHTRCPRSLGELCANTAPPVHEPRPGHRIACHLSLDELARDASVLPEAAPVAAAE
ncbi:ABC transporter ATP-binding protein [Ancylobacter sp. MQZ15Z-1]|uniref:ABC transporter ATP-binding protein n=1 Tax=Ancylobacter mangrovi TaxID=2972472 RepID=A0A9X2PDQ9_9HYPH|nr:ABC transporter ATP-binding protein [Ancylobacter mangrovi]MCS0496844.1 ABC transporter ATP-binding protein [Ancylobacter mangrovi]